MIKAGILAGRERSFPNALIQKVAERRAGVEAEWIKLSGTSLNYANPYAVIVDRISHEVPYYALYLKHARRQGVYVINDPFARAVEDKFNAYVMAVRLGVAVPRTVALPNKSYIPDISWESLTNLTYPMDWQGVADYVGLPAVVKPASGVGWKAVSVVHSEEEMIAAYDRSGLTSMMVQEYIPWDRYVRCLCVGRKQVLPVAWDPRRPHHARYWEARGYLSSELTGRVMAEALNLCGGLGYDMNTVEFAIRGNTPYAIDFTNSAPDFDVSSLGEGYFHWVIEAMADLVIAKALEGPYPTSTGYGPA